MVSVPFALLQAELVREVELDVSPDAGVLARLGELHGGGERLNVVAEDGAGTDAEEPGPDDHLAAIARTVVVHLAGASVIEHQSAAVGERGRRRMAARAAVRGYRESALGHRLIRRGVSGG